jgi:hypothetical protein
MVIASARIQEPIPKSSCGFGDEAVFFGHLDTNGSQKPRRFLGIAVPLTQSPVVTKYVAPGWSQGYDVWKNGNRPKPRARRHNHHP